jgi:short-subunit dehydrogenase
MSTLKSRYGSWALVTGATSGIGAELTRQLAAAGLNVVTCSRTVATLEAQAVALRKEFGVEVRPVAADLSTRAGASKLMDAAADLEVGVLVPCAALEQRGYFVDEPLPVHEALLEMDVAGPLRLAHHFGAKMAARKRGAILFVSSLSGWMPQPYMAHYGAAKAYVLALAQGLHEEMKDQGVDVSVLSPGPTQTPMMESTGIDFGAMGMAIMQPREVAASGLAALGRQADAIPGLRNRVMAFMMTRVMSRGAVAALFKKMMGRALKLGPAVASPARS